MAQPHEGDDSTLGALRFLHLDDQALIGQCEVDCYRSRGPGGQKRNKTSSAVRLRHLPTGLAVTATEERSQHVNKARALRRLRAALALNVRAHLDAERYRVSELLAQCISRDGRIVVGRRDARYPLAVAEILDVLAAHECRVPDTAQVLGVSTAQLLKFLRNDPKLWDGVTRLRAGAGLDPLRSV